jgi:hypothetical protein
MVILAGLFELSDQPPDVVTHGIHHAGVTRHFFAGKYYKFKCQSGK